MSDRDVVIRVENISKLYRLGEETASTVGDHRAEWGGEIDFAQDSFAGYHAEFGADQGDPGSLGSCAGDC